MGDETGYEEIDSYHLFFSDGNIPNCQTVLDYRLSNLSWVHEPSKKSLELKLQLQCIRNKAAGNKYAYRWGKQNY